MSTITVSSGFTNGVAVSAGVATSNNYAVIPISWTGLDGYPEVVVETSLDDTTYYPAMVVDYANVTRPIKLRLSREDGSESLTVDSIYGATPYVRIKVYQNAATTGTITYSIDAG